MTRASTDHHVFYFSKDGGDTWSEPRELPAFWSHNTMPFVMRLNDGRILAIWNNTQILPEMPTVDYPELGATAINGCWEWVFTNRDALHAAISEDDGRTWKYVQPMGVDFTCIISFFGMVQLKDGSYFGVYHRHPNANGDVNKGEKNTAMIMSSVSRDGGLTWEKPNLVARKDGYELCEPAVFYSPDQKELCMLIRENSGRHPSQMCFSKDEGKTWSEGYEYDRWGTYHRATCREIGVERGSAGTDFVSGLPLSLPVWACRKAVISRTAVSLGVMAFWVMHMMRTASSRESTVPVWK